MRHRPFFTLAMVVLAIGTLASAFVAGARWTSFNEVAEFRRALGVYRWTITVPPDADGHTLFLQLRSDDRIWESGQRQNVRGGERYAIYLRRDLHAKQLEYAILTNDSQLRGVSEDPLTGGPLFVDRPQGECRSGDFLLVGGERVSLSGTERSAQHSVTLLLQPKESATE
jgi:hypothetical protein